jgi:DNA-directed RNA polymerase sigma subunit (sigma70/sigma32)
LSSKEEAALLETLRREEASAKRAAAERLAEGNLRWVVQIARDYAGAGVPLSDLIQEGNLALWSAIQGYEGEEAFEQSLEKDIRGAMKALLREEGSYGRLEEQMTALANRILDTVKEMEEESGEAVSAAQISQKLGIPESRVEEVLRQSAKAMKNAES